MLATIKNLVYYFNYNFFFRFENGRNFVFAFFVYAVSLIRSGAEDENIHLT